MQAEQFEMLRAQTLSHAVNDQKVNELLYSSLLNSETINNETYESLAENLQSYNGQNSRIYHQLANEMNKRLSSKTEEDAALSSLEQRILELEAQVSKQSKEEGSVALSQELQLECSNKEFELTNEEIKLDESLEHLFEFRQQIDQRLEQLGNLHQKFIEENDLMGEKVSKLEQKFVDLSTVLRENSDLRNQFILLEEKQEEENATVQLLFERVFPELVESSSEEEEVVNKIDNGSVISSVDDLEDNPARKSRHTKRKISAGSAGSESESGENARSKATDAQRHHHHHRHHVESV